MPVPLPEKVKAELKGRTVHVEGPKGKLDFDVPGRIDVEIRDGQVVVTRENDQAEARALHGLTRALINNMVHGVSTGYSKRLEIHGVGFKASVAGGVITMLLGYAHPINYPIPAGVQVTVEDGTKILIQGADKQLVGQVASELRSFYPPEPYKGKGVRYADERVVRKEGKKVQ